MIFPCPARKPGTAQISRDAFALFSVSGQRWQRPAAVTFDLRVIEPAEKAFALALLEELDRFHTVTFAEVPAFVTVRFVGAILLFGRSDDPGAPGAVVVAFTTEIARSA